MKSTVGLQGNLESQCIALSSLCRVSTHTASGGRGAGGADAVDAVDAADAEDAAGGSRAVCIARTRCRPAGRRRPRNSRPLPHTPR